MAVVIFHQQQPRLAQYGAGHAGARTIGESRTTAPAAEGHFSSRRAKRAAENRGGSHGGFQMYDRRLCLAEGRRDKRSLGRSDLRVPGRGRRRGCEGGKLHVVFDRQGDPEQAEEEDRRPTGTLQLRLGHSLSLPCTAKGLKHFWVERAVHHTIVGYKSSDLDQRQSFDCFPKSLSHQIPFRQDPEDVKGLWQDVHLPQRLQYAHGDLY